MLVVRGGEHDYRTRRHTLDDLKAAEPRHVDVEEEDVDRIRGDASEALGRIGRAAHDLDATGGLEHAGKPLEGERLVVDEKGAQRRARAHGVANRGNEIVTSAPPSRRPISSVASAPKRAASRPRRLSSPCPTRIASAAKPGPSSQTDSRT